MNDEKRFKKLREKDPEAVRSLMASYLPSIWRFVYVRVKGDNHLAEDIVSETALALIKAIGEDKEIDDPGAWMRTVAQNKVVDHFRSAARVRQLMQKIAQTVEPAHREDASSVQLHEERREEVRQIMDGLTEQHRIVLEWKYLENLSVKEIAGRWSTTEKAVESILFRARCEFRDRHREREKKDEPANPPGIRKMSANNGHSVEMIQPAPESLETHR